VHGTSAELAELRALVSDFAKVHGRQPRILVAKMGQDGHDRGAKVIASSFADFGFDVDLSPLFQTPESIAQQAIDNDVHVIGISTLAGGHNTLVPELLDFLKKQGVSNIIIIVGGVVPPADQLKLKALGVAEIFGPGTNSVEAATAVLRSIKP
jgi:methylmalonyl-CoA mutase